MMFNVKPDLERETKDGLSPSDYKEGNQHTLHTRKLNNSH